jgi:hypothetical protein
MRPKAKAPVWKKTEVRTKTVVPKEESSISSSGSNDNYYSCLEDDEEEEKEEALPTRVWFDYKKPKFKGKCYGCGKTGHYVKDCIVRQKKKTDPWQAKPRTGPKRSNPDRNYRKRFNRKQRQYQAQDQIYLGNKCKLLDDQQQVLAKTVLQICQRLGLPDEELYDCIKEHAYVMGEQKLTPSSSIFLGDSGASTHMGNEDEGMYDIQDINDPVTVGNGKVLRATKVGKLRRTVHQMDGSTLDVVLPDYKFVPGLHANLFSITKALSSGWTIGNKGVKLTLSKAGHSIEFDRVFKTENGYLCGVELLPRSEQAHPTVDTAATTEHNGKSVKHWNINRLHKVLNHASEEVLRLTAKDYNWTIQGVFEKCPD